MQKVKLVVEYEIDDELFKGCRTMDEKQWDYYNEVMRKIVTDLTNDLEHNSYDWMKQNTNIKGYTLYDDTCDLIFEA